MKSHTNRPSGLGFTLVEMLLVVAMIALLIAILLPAMSKAKEIARRALCMSNLRQMGNACVAYSRDFNNTTPNSPRQTNVAAGSINDGSRNVQHSQNPATDRPEVIGKAMAGGYLPLQSQLIFCPSRDPKARYAAEALIFGWANWAPLGTVEYSYQHRLDRRLNKTNSSQIFGADLGIMDNYYVGATFIGSISCGANVAHQDEYYNVSYFDMSCRSFIDKNRELDNPIYFNRPGHVLNKMEQID